MATTLNQVFQISCGLVDELSDAGLVVTSNVADYIGRTPSIVNALEPELLKIGDVYLTYTVSHKPYVNLLGGFRTIEYTGTEQTFESAKVAKAYSFYIDGTGTVYVEDSADGSTWTTLVTVASTVTEKTHYSGVLTPTSGATKTRIRLGGSYYYCLYDPALFEYPFKTAPDFTAWVPVSMPSTFKSVNQVVSIDPNGRMDVSYKWEGKNTLLVDYYFDGNIKIVYRPVPTLLTAMTDSVTIDDVTARSVLPYGLAAQLVMADGMQDMGLFLQNRYNELKKQMGIKPATFSETEDVYR